MSWASSLILNEREHIVHSWEGNYNEPRTIHVKQKKSFGRSRTIEKETTKYQGGILVLTTKKLIWLEKKGLIGKSHHALFEIFLRSLQAI